MEQRCTCGALLPADARFCHKCGKPQYQEDIDRMEALEAEAAPKQPIVQTAAVEPTPGSGVGNLRAVGVTMASAAFVLFLMVIVGMIFPPVLPLILCAGGFAAARLYGMKQAITALNGALLGTMTGMWLFLIFAVCTGTASVTLATPEGQAMMKGLSPTVAPEMIHMLQDPHQMVTGFLLPVFFLLVLSSAFGGLLAARLRRPNR